MALDTVIRSKTRDLETEGLRETGKMLTLERISSGL